MEPEDEEKTASQTEAQQVESEPEAPTPVKAAKRRNNTWAFVVLVIIIVGVPLWYMTVLIPRLRVAGFEAVLGDVAPSGEVCFSDESGRDALGVAKGAFSKENFTIVPKTDEWKKVAVAAPASQSQGAKTEQYSPQRVYVESIKWAGTNQYEIKAGWKNAPEYGAGATYVFEVSLFGYNLVDTKDRWVTGPKGEAGTGKPGMPQMAGGGAAPAEPRPQTPSASMDPTK